MNYYLYYTTNIRGEIELNPSEFLDCKDEDDVRDFVWDLVLSNIDIPGSSELEYNDWTIPESFWEEWRKLKEYEKDTKEERN